MPSVLIATTFVVAAFVYAVLFIGPRDRRLPLGPPGLPVLGNLHQIPTKRTHLKFLEWAKQYGEIFSLQMGTKTAIVITSPRLVKELVDKKASLYSSRPPSYIGNTIISQNHHMLLMPYADQRRKCRKLVHQFFMEPLVVKQHTPLVNAEVVQMLNDFIVDPAAHMQHSKRFSNSVTVSLLYDIRTPTIQIMEMFSRVMEPGNTPPVDIFPFLKWVPERLFGMWRSRAQAVSKEMNALYRELIDTVDRRRESSGSHGCFMDRVLDEQEKLGFDRHAVYFLCGSLMEAGSDTSSAIIIAFIHAMTKWPEIQKKAQKQIDEVIGEERTPTFGDYEKLPYVAACVKETMRWRPVLPLGFPHSLTEDDWVDGMLLSKGSDVFIDAFGMQHDEKRFQNPDTFDPDHYKGVTALASELAGGDWGRRYHYGYGAGRRVCQGMHLAERNLFLAMAKSLWAFNIEAGQDALGNRIEPDISNETGYSAGFLVCAEPCACKITPRSTERKTTIFREFETAESDVFSRYDVPKA